MTGIVQDIIAVIMIYNIYEYSASFCDQRADGYYADPTTCYKYYHCDGFGATFTFDCGASLIWSEDLLTCVTDPYGGNCLPVTTNSTVGCETYCLNMTTRYNGPELVATAVKDSIVGCARACKQNSNICQGFNFFAAQGTCELFSDIQPSVLVVDESWSFSQACLDTIQ